jgi:long-chain fatty acid transport protein
MTVGSQSNGAVMLKSFLSSSVGCVALGLVAMTSQTLAGGFAVREQSAEFQGMSFAGAAAGGGGLSGMFWNPAVIGEFDGFNTDSSYSLIVPSAEITGDTTFGGVGFGMPASSGNMGELALVPASYASYQLSDDLVVGLSMNAPFGLSNKTDNFWVGQTFNRQSEVTTYNAQLALAYDVTPDLTVAGGLMVDYMSARITRSSGINATSKDVDVKGDDIGVGFTAGLTWRPMDGTSLGIGYRSAIKHSLEGNIFIPDSIAPASAGANVGLGVTLPETVTIGLRQDISDNTRLLVGAEWTNWSRLKVLDVKCTGAANPVFCPAGAGQTVQGLEFNWHDGYFVSAGLEHDVNDQLTLRGGAAYEISPVRNPDERSLRVPDSDRVWLSLGASYKITDSMKANLAYSHVFFEEGQIDRTESGIRFIGKSKAHLDIISAGLSMTF